MSWPLILSAIICLSRTFHPCFVSLGGPVSPASFTSSVCTWLPWRPEDEQEDGQAKSKFERFPPAAWGSATQTHPSAHLYARPHAAHILPIFSLHSSSVSLYRSSIFLDTLLQHCCGLLTPASQVAQLPHACLKWCNTDMIIWKRVNNSHAKKQEMLLQSDAARRENILVWSSQCFSTNV